MAPPRTAPADDRQDDAPAGPALAPESRASALLDPTADAQRRLDEMLDLLRREQAQAHAPAADAAPPPNLPPADAPPAAEAPADESVAAEAAAEANCEDAPPPEPAADVVSTLEFSDFDGLEFSEPAIEPDPEPRAESPDHREVPPPLSDAEPVNAEPVDAEPVDAEPVAAAEEPRRVPAGPAVDPFESLAGLGLAKPAGAAAAPAAARPPLRSLLSEMFDLDLSDERDEPADAPAAPDDAADGSDLSADWRESDRSIECAPAAAEEGDGAEFALTFEEESVAPYPTESPRTADAVAEAPAGRFEPTREAPSAVEPRADVPVEEEPFEEEAAFEDADAEEAPSPEDAPVEPAAGGSVEQSVDDYMEALLARMRQTRGDDPTPAAPARKPAAKPAPKRATAAPAPESASPSALTAPKPKAEEPSSPAPLPPPPALPRPRVDKEKLRQEMRQLRAIANTSARSAVMESTWRRTRNHLVVTVLLCGVCLGLGLTLILTSVWGDAVHYGLGGALCFAAVWIARDFGRTVDLLRRQKIAAEKAATAEVAETGLDPGDAGERALNVPSGG